jgi:hypothetical protein
VLDKIDSTYKKLLQAFMPEVQQRVHNVSGYLIITSTQIRGATFEKDDEFYLFNTVTQAHVRPLMTVLTEDDLSFHGFMFVVFHILMDSPANEIGQAALVDRLHAIDHRFPKYLVAGQGGGRNEFELDDLRTLLERMKQVSE